MQYLKVEFNVKYGKNVIEIPIDENAKPKHKPYHKNDKFTQKCTIYNDIPADGVNDRSFNRFVIEKCLVYGGTAERSVNGTIQNIVNAQTVITKDIERYKTPLDYAHLPVDEKTKYYTANANDFIVFAEVDDIVTTSLEFRDLQDKYKNNGMSITAANPYIFGLATDNVTMTNA